MEPTAAGGLSEPRPTQATGAEEAGGERGSAPERAWMERREKGTAAGVRFILIFSRIFGRTGARLFLRFLIFYYALFAREAARASRQYQARLAGTSPETIGFWAVYRHLLRFAETSLDRVFLVQGRTDLFSTTHTGIEHLEALRAEKRGAILLGAHLGSFEAMRAVGSFQDFPINILAYWENARLITRFLDEVGADFRGRVIEIRPGDPSYIFAVQEAIDAGEMVAVLGDRIGVNEKTATVEFLGAPARLPIGPYTMAAVLKCPIYLTFGLYSPPNRYDLYCEPLCERLELPRRGRQEVIASYAQRYADRLAHYCRKAPDNWFNFFDFWGEGGDE
jgi:predicted LPLAT superfamily acyltransferase